MRAGRHDNRPLNNNESSALMALRASARAMNAKLRIHQDSLCNSNKLEASRKTSDPASGQNFDLNDVTKWDESIQFNPNNAFVQCTREM